jgi:hypothetical protein
MRELNTVETQEVDGAGPLRGFGHEVGEFLRGVYDELMA